MGLVAVLRRRWRLHPSAMAAVIATLMLCLLVVASLRAFAGGIADASVRSSVLASTEEARLIRISTTLRPDMPRASPPLAASPVGRPRTASSSPSRPTSPRWRG